MESWFLSSAARLSCGRVPRLTSDIFTCCHTETEREDDDFVSACHIVLAPIHPAGRSNRTHDLILRRRVLYQLAHSAGSHSQVHDLNPTPLVHHSNTLLSYWLKLHALIGLSTWDAVSRQVQCCSSSCTWVDRMYLWVWWDLTSNLKS